MRSKAALGLLGLGLLVIASAALGAAAGSTVIDLPAALGELLSGQAASSHARILLHVRLPRVCASLLCGSALSVSGMLIQAVLSNALASPNVIGVNAGAGFCTFLAMALAPGAAGAAPIGAFFGALAATLLVYAVAAGAGAGKLTIILAGVAVSSIFTAGINTIKTFFPDTLYNGSTFLIGGFSGVSFSDISPAWMMILPALAGGGNRPQPGPSGKRHPLWADSHRLRAGWGGGKLFRPGQLCGAFVSPHCPAAVRPGTAPDSAACRGPAGGQLCHPVRPVKPGAVRAL